MEPGRRPFPRFVRFIWFLFHLAGRNAPRALPLSTFNLQLSTALAVLISIICSYTTFAASTNSPPQKPFKPAQLRISGYGLLGNRELKRSLVTLELGGKKPEFFSSAMVEDSALLLVARVKRDGYLRPSVAIRLQLAEGGELQTDARALLVNPLPRSLRITRAEFRIHPGVRYYFKSLQFTGLKTITDKVARSYFMETETLFSVKHARLYTPARLEHGLASLTEVLNRQGYGEATVVVSELSRDDRTGSVVATIHVDQGPQLIVRSVRQEFSYQGVPRPAETKSVYPNQPYSRLWVQDFSLSLKTNQYHRGYPDVDVTLQTLRREPEGDRFQLDLLATVTNGPQMWIGAVEFKGEKHTSESLLKRRVRIQRGDLLDPIRVENGRYRLARLGIFDSVTVSYEPEDERSRAIVYSIVEAKRLTLSLLAGYGSYELLRGGFEADINNIWGLAHRAQLKAIQSFKSSSGDFTYTIPELIGKDTDLFLNASGLRREEINFTRLEYGGGIGLHKYFEPAATDVAARYSYQILSTLDFGIQEIASEGLTNPAVGSVIFDIKHDRRDNPLFPRTGYKIFATIETATEYLGGDANYERLEVAPSWYHPLGGGLFLGLAVSQGTDISFGSAANNLPFNKRFFPGGGNSIRGYTEGQAAPRNSLGQLVGAETYTLATVQLEQALTPKWSVVAFLDALGEAENLNHFPFDTGLFSVGPGIWWRSLIGPVRLEYGYNLNPRPGDPQGTVQFSLGFPF
jgi:outer membrane protein assembly complex protein YaeT